MKKTFSENLMLRALIVASGGSARITAEHLYQAERLLNGGEPLRTFQIDRPPELELRFNDNRKREREGAMSLAAAIQDPDKAQAERARLAIEAPVPEVMTLPEPIPTPEQGGWKYPVRRIESSSVSQNFVHLAACLEALGGYLLVDPRFLGTLRPGDHVSTRVVADGSLEMRLVHVEQEFHPDTPEQLALRKPNPPGLL